MPRRHDDLIGDIADFGNLLEAVRLAARGKRCQPSCANFLAAQEKHLVRISRQLGEGSWQPGPYRAFTVHDPKTRMVSAAPFHDRVVHHALCRVVAPLFERGFVDESYANRRGKGTHRAVARYEHYRDRHAWALRCDIWRYFPAIDHQILKAGLRRRIACQGTLRVLDAIIDGSNPQEAVHHYFPGDDLFTPFERRRGLPIGNLTSQFFANVYLDPLDHWIKQVLRVPGYVRYVDDFVLFGDDAEQLAEWRRRIDGFLAGRRLLLHPRKTRIVRSAAASPFLGYVLLPGGRRRLDDANVDRFAGRLRALRQDWREGRIEIDAVGRRVGAWIAHARHADTWRLRVALFRNGLFDPRREPGRPF